MKTCPVCKQKLAEAFQFCPEDGSSLKAPASPGNVCSEPLPSPVEEPIINPETAVAPAVPVLYCPACALEYPLTFTECPVHGVSLSKTRQAQVIKNPEVIRPLSIHPSRQKQPEQIINTQVEEKVAPLTAAISEDDFETSEPYAAPAFAKGDAPEQTPRPSHKIAAVLTTIALIAFGLISIYVLYTKVARKPSSVKPDSAQKPLVIRVPRELSATTLAQTTGQSTDTPVEDKASEDSQRDTSAVKAPESSQPVHDNRAAEKVESAKAGVLASDRPHPFNEMPRREQLPPLPPPVSSRIEARLLRSHASRTGAGYRYDLTFNLQDIAGQVTQWERLVIATHTASGITHNQVVPFFHRLGASGALTFTVSVEMAGRSEHDWRGRVICTGIGSDNSGRVYRANFGASVTP